jgi:hypothetical protein
MSSLRRYDLLFTSVIDSVPSGTHAGIGTHGDLPLTRGDFSALGIPNGIAPGYFRCRNAWWHDLIPFPLAVIRGSALTNLRQTRRDCPQQKRSWVGSFLLLDPN